MFSFLSPRRSIEANPKRAIVRCVDDYERATQRVMGSTSGKSFFSRNQSPNLPGFTARSMEARRLRAQSNMRLVSGSSIGAAHLIQALRSRAFA